MTRATALLLAAGAVATTDAALSQPIPTAPAEPGLRPGDDRPALPEFREPQPPVLPPLPDLPAQPERPSSGLAVFVREIRIEGNTAFSDEALAPVVAPFEDRTITTEELLDLRDRLTRTYVEAGYITRAPSFRTRT